LKKAQMQSTTMIDAMPVLHERRMTDIK